MQRLRALLTERRQHLVQVAESLADAGLGSEARSGATGREHCFHCLADLLVNLLSGGLSPRWASALQVPPELAAAVASELPEIGIDLGRDSFLPLLWVKPFRTACALLLDRENAGPEEYGLLYQGVDLIELAILHYQRDHRQQLFWSATDQLPQPALVLDRNSLISHVNQQAEQVLGCQRQAIVGMAAELVFPWLAEALTGFSGLNKLDVTRVIPTSEGERYSAIRLARVASQAEGDSGTIVLLHDLSDRYRHESELWLSEHKFRHLFENLGSAMFIGTAVDEGQDFLITDVNLAAERLEQITRRETVGKTLDQLWPGSAGLLLPTLRRVWRTGVAEQLTLPGLPSGTRNRHLRLFRLPQGELVAAYDDLAAQQETARRLERTRQRMSDIIEFLPDATMAVNLQGQVTIWNRAMEQLTGVGKGEMLGRGDQAYTVPFYGHRRHGLVDVLLQATGEPSLDTSSYRDWKREGDSLYASTWAPALNGGQGAFVTSKVALLRNLEGNVVGAIQSIRDVSDLQSALQEAESERERLTVTLSSIGDAVLVVDNDGRVVMLNPVGEELTGWPASDAVGRPLTQVFHIVNEHTGELAANPVEQALREGKVVGLANHTALVSRTGQIRSIADSAAPIRDQTGETQGAILVFRDVSEERSRNLALRTSEGRLRHITDNLLDIVAEVNRHGVISYASPSFQKVLGYDTTEVIGRSAFDFIHPDDRQAAVSAFDPPRLRENDRLEVRCLHADGRHLWFEVAANLLNDESGRFAGVLLAARDVTSRRRLEHRLRYLSWHDSLTGVFNRAYFEERMHELDRGKATQVGMLFCDVDGLKLINDTMGHEEGDLALQTLVRLISESCPEPAVVARIGGDEIAVLLPGVTSAELEAICRGIAQRVEHCNRDSGRFPLSISIGSAHGGSQHVPMHRLFKEADDAMYRVKLHRSQSTRSAIVSTLMRALEARDFVTEGHADRLQQTVQQLGQSLALPESTISDLKLLAQFHDIGKVGTPDRILFKAGPLTKEETAEMRRHCEIGHRIAQSAPDLVPVADLILKHHEWWDGQGYPLGLRGEEIPLACRILAIADAYDAMTSDRPYRRALSQAAALAELRRKAGSQFDPELVPKFIRLVAPGELEISTSAVD